MLFLDGLLYDLNLFNTIADQYLDLILLIIVFVGFFIVLLLLVMEQTYVKLVQFLTFLYDELSNHVLKSRQIDQLYSCYTDIN